LTAEMSLGLRIRVFGGWAQGEERGSMDGHGPGRTDTDDLL
jgi:hypothetical protein